MTPPTVVLGGLGIIEDPPRDETQNAAVARRAHERAVQDEAAHARRTWSRWRTSTLTALEAAWAAEVWKDPARAERMDADVEQWKRLRSRTKAAYRRWLRSAPAAPAEDAR